MQSIGHIHDLHAGTPVKRHRVRCRVAISSEASSELVPFRNNREYAERRYTYNKFVLVEKGQVVLGKDIKVRSENKPLTDTTTEH